MSLPAFPSDTSQDSQGYYYYEDSDQAESSAKVANGEPWGHFCYLIAISGSFDTVCHVHPVFLDFPHQRVHGDSRFNHPSIFSKFCLI